MKKKVLVYAGTLRSGGGGSVLNQVVDFLNSSGFEYEIFLGDKRLIEEFKGRNDVKDECINTIFSSLPAFAVYFFSKIYFLFRSGFSKNKCILFSFNQYLPSFYESCVYHINLLSFIDEKGVGAIVRRYDARLALLYATNNVFESFYLKKMAEQYTGIKKDTFGVIHVFLNSEFSASASASASVSDEDRAVGNLIAVTSPAKHKNNFVLYDCIRDLNKLAPEVDWKLRVVGGQDVSSWAEDMDYVESIGVSKSVSFTGPVSRHALNQMYRESYCMINASTIESMYMVAVEAMLCGCPCIVFDNSSAKESVGDAGVVIEGNDPKRMAQEVINITTDKDMHEALVVKGLEHSKIFSKESFVEKFDRIMSKNA